MSQVHQIWFQGEPPDYLRRRMRKNFPEATLWNERQILDLIKEHYPNYLEWFQNLRTLIVKCDVARAFILHFHGGIYADCDFDPNSNFANFGIQDAVVFAGDPWFGCNNYLISSPPKAPFWLKYLDAIAQTLEEPLLKDMFTSILLTTWPILSLSGPVQIRRLINQYPDLARVSGKEGAWGSHGGRDERGAWFSMSQYRLQKYTVLFLFFFAVIGILKVYSYIA